MTKRNKELENIKNKVIDCKACPLYKNRIYPVVGEGNHSADIIFVGEAPGAQESKTGRPFCGAAGKILDELLDSAGINRKDIYITNILKDRPPKNRDPQSEEIKSCVPYLEKQIEIIKPKLVCSLGRHAMIFLMERFGLSEELDQISKIHGKAFEADSFKFIPFYHPAVAVYNANMKETLKKDFKILKTI